MTKPAQSFDPIVAATRVLRNFTKGAIGPAEMWAQLAEVLALSNSDVRSILNALPIDLRIALRHSFEERPLSFEVLDDHPLQPQIARWCGA